VWTSVVWSPVLHGLRRAVRQIPPAFWAIQLAGTTCSPAQAGHDPPIEAVHPVGVCPRTCWSKPPSLSSDPSTGPSPAFSNSNAILGDYGLTVVMAALMHRLLCFGWLQSGGRQTSLRGPGSRALRAPARARPARFRGARGSRQPSLDQFRGKSECTPEAISCRASSPGRRGSTRSILPQIGHIGRPRLAGVGAVPPSPVLVRVLKWPAARPPLANSTNTKAVALLMTFAWNPPFSHGPLPFVGSSAASTLIPSDLGR
jgi:hypothetical protein